MFSIRKINLLLFLLILLGNFYNDLVWGNTHSIVTDNIIEQSFFERNNSWEEMESEKYRILFQAYHLDISFSTLLLLNEMNPVLFRNMIDNISEQRQIPIVFDTEALVFNGIAHPITLYHTQFYPNTDHYLLTSSNPYLLLLIHEGRHMAQFQLNYQANRWSRFTHVVFGESTGYALANYLLPSWYYEGDAVLWETLFSAGGRGRIPLFDINFRARILYESDPGTDYQGLPYKDSWGGGLPQLSPYVLGYYLITYFNIHYGDQ